jgi:hypothetical protein
MLVPPETGMNDFLKFLKDIRAYVAWLRLDHLFSMDAKCPSKLILDALWTAYPGSRNLLPVLHDASFLTWKSCLHIVITQNGSVPLRHLNPFIMIAMI